MKNLVSFLLFIITANCFSQDTIVASQAKDYMDKIVVLKGKVMSFRLASEGKSTNYINIDKAFPDQVFTIVMSNSYLEKQTYQINDWVGKTLYFKGKVSVYKNDPKQIPQIFNPESIVLKKE